MTAKHVKADAGRHASQPVVRDSQPLGARVAMELDGLLVDYSHVGENACYSEEYDLVELTTRSSRTPARHAQPEQDDALEFSASFDGEVLEVSATPRCELVVKRCCVTLRHAFSADEAVLLNGYQSWTDTAERPAWAAMRGLRGVPEALYRRYALDALGDYTFVDYPGKPGHQHGFTYATFRRGEGMVLVASLDDTGGFTLIRTDAARGVVSLETEPPVGALQAGRRTVLGRYVIARGTRDACYDRWFELSGVSARPVKPVVGYTSWYRHYGDIDAAKLENDLDGMKAEFACDAPAGNRVASGCLKLFQVDDGYCKVGDWLELDRGKFPQGLRPLAESAREAGFTAGLWVAPFVCERESRLFKEHPDWLLRDGRGEPVATGPHWSGGIALDTRNDDVRAYIRDVLATMTRDWGFALLKADFLYAACLVKRDGMNRGELMADAMRLLRDAVGPDTLILGCGVPLASAFGLVDYCRIGCDVGLDWDDKLYMRALHRERVSTKNSLGNTYARAPLDGRAFGNDPDVFFLRDDVALAQSERDELLFADADLGSVLLTSDDMGAWTPEMRARYDEALSLFTASKGARL